MTTDEFDPKRFLAPFEGIIYDKLIYERHEAEKLRAVVAAMVQAELPEQHRAAVLAELGYASQEDLAEVFSEAEKATAEAHEYLYGDPED